MTLSLGRYVALRPMAAQLGLTDGARDGWSHVRWWLGRDAADDSTVAIGTVRAQHAEAVRRAEERAAGVAHAHLLPLRDVVEGDGEIGMVLPWPGADSLRAVLDRRGRLRVGELLTAVSPVAAALATVHAAGLVHGSVGSASIWLDGSGRPSLVALAPALLEQELDGSLPGTVADLSPEVVRAQQVSSASDVFSLGSVLLHGLSGYPAWPADDAADVLVQSAAGLWPDLPDDAEPAGAATLVRRMLDPDPARRPPAASIPARLSILAVPVPLDMTAAVADPAGPAVARDDAGAPGTEPEATPVPVPTDADPRAAEHPHEHPGGAAASEPPAEPRRSRRRTRAVPRRRVLAIGVGVVSAALLAVGAIQAGLWWASWGGPAAGADPLPAGTAPPAATSLSPGTAIPSPSPPAASAPSPSSAADPASGVADWPAVVAELDARRADAFALGDPGLLDTVYAAGTSARGADAAAIDALSAAGLRLPGAAHVIRSVEEIPDTATTLPGGMVRLRVVDALPAYPILDASGSSVGSSPSRDESEHIVGLVREGSDYRIVSLEDP